MAKRPTKADVIRKHGSITAAARKASLNPHTLASRLEKNERDQIVERAGKSKKLSDFRAIFDKSFIIPKRIKEGLKSLGAQGWEYEAQFARVCGVSLADLSAYRDEFSDYIVQVNRDGRRAWAGSPALAGQMRDMVR